MPRGAQLTMACSGSWCRTTYKGQSGYGAKAYIKALTPTSSILSPALPPQKAPVVYANCSAARAAGAAPIMLGKPGYASKLDRDRNGIACE
ncbi:excalibur calcium-binding domain-containing protein [Deinococcus hohokamensis]|uniref:Excalibur calcium-binding domain-containing protein n=1 Tax=Deinococcus hohokamensis TaxID=309883 RepID=A0ABV9I6P6_9DEIO